MTPKPMHTLEEIEEALIRAERKDFAVSWPLEVLATAYREAAAERDVLRNELVSVREAWEASKKDREFHYSGRIEAMEHAEKAQSRESALADQNARLREGIGAAKCLREPSCDERYYQEGRCAVCEAHEYSVDNPGTPSVAVARARLAVVEAAKELYPSQGLWEDEPRIDYDEVQIDKTALKNFRDALVAMEAAENAAKDVMWGGK